MNYLQESSRGKDSHRAKSNGTNQKRASTAGKAREPNSRVNPNVTNSSQKDKERRYDRESYHQP